MSKRTLQRLNYTVGGIQLVLFVFLIVWLLSIDSESVSEDGLVSFPIGEYNQPLSEGRDHGSVSIETIVSLLAIFTLITGLVHIFAYARSSKSYQRGVEQGTNWVRWVEYSITATIMLFVIAVTCGTNSTDGLVLMSVATLCCMLCGYISEATATTNKRVSMLATGVGWLLLLAVFTVLLRRFWSIYTQTQGTDSGPPPWVMGNCYFIDTLVYVVWVYSFDTHEETVAGGNIIRDTSVPPVDRGVIHRVVGGGEDTIGDSISFGSIRPNTGIRPAFGSVS